MDDLQDRIKIMSTCLDNREPVTQAQVQNVVLTALSLSRQIGTTINDIGSDIVERQTIMMVRELKAGKHFAILSPPTFPPFSFFSPSVSVSV